MPVTIIGMGPMERALAGAFVKNGHLATVWNRSAGKTDALVKEGAVLADTIGGAVAASPLVIVCVLDYDAVQSILAPVGSELQGRTLVNLTADTPARAREMAAWAAGHGIDYLDGAIMTPTPSIGTPAASILYSGPESVYRNVQSALSSLGGTASYLGSDPGRAAAHDVALLDLFWTSMSGYVHALALAASEHISAKDFAVHARGIAAILPDIITGIADEADEGRYPGDASNLVSAEAGMAHIIHAAEHHGIDASVLSAARALARRAIDEGLGEDGFGRLAELLSRRSGA
ncbi:NAD(P)-dependent oxidoreductase [Paenibacillus arenilitoris]|nr:NAD(P)-binding domain-containing protein [Paenibacillus arenilitoris]